jgi:hypothetical protein
MGGAGGDQIMWGTTLHGVLIYILALPRARGFACMYAWGPPRPEPAYTTFGYEMLATRCSLQGGSHC